MRAAFALTFVLLPATGMAQDGSTCRQSIFSQDLRIEVTDVQDLGAGIVQQTSQGVRETSGSERVAFQHCASGQAINAVLATWDESGRVAAPANPVDIMMAAMQSPDSLSLTDIVAEMTAAGVDAEVTTWDRETCGCALFYPAARGDKSPWVAP
jgi:hypothetical protein